MGRGLMEHYVTLFDRHFAPQGLALLASLRRHAGEHTLWVIALDPMLERLLDDLDLDGLRVIGLSEIEGERLRSIKVDRTLAEYAWTLTPFAFDAVLERAPDAQRVTYVDADVWLVADPRPLLDEFAATGAAVQLTDHAYAPEHDQTATSGRFCVQFLTMDREGSRTIRTWWQDRCIEWCFARFEDGKFGDQKYLDDWPERFGDRVHVAREPAWFQAPWNAVRFAPELAVAYHFHGLRLRGGRSVRLTNRRYELPRAHRRRLYRPYLADLAGALATIGSVHGEGTTAFVGVEEPGSGGRRALRRRVGRLVEAIRGPRRAWRRRRYEASLPRSR